MCLQPPGTSQMVVPFGQHCLLNTSDLQFWSQRPHISVLLNYAGLQHALSLSYTKLCMPHVLPLSEIACFGFLLIDEFTVSKHLLLFTCTRMVHTVRFRIQSCYILCYLIKISSWELIAWLFRNSVTSLLCLSHYIFRIKWKLETFTSTRSDSLHSWTHQLWKSLHHQDLIFPRI